MDGATRTLRLKSEYFDLFGVSGFPVLQCHFLLKAHALSTYVDPEVHASGTQTYESASDLRANALALHMGVLHF